MALRWLRALFLVSQRFRLTSRLLYLEFRLTIKLYTKFNRGISE